MAPHSSTLAWKIPWTEEPGGLQSTGALESETTEWLHFHSLEKEMATHSSVLAWRIPGTGEPGGLPSLGSHRVGHNWSDLAAAEYLIFWGNARLFSKTTTPFYNPTCIAQVSQFLHVFTNTCYSFFIFYFSHSVCTVSHCGFMLFFHLATPPGLWDLISLTRDRTCAPCSGRVES